MTLNKLMFVTSNDHKVQEVKEALSAAGLGIELEKLDIGYPEVQVETLEEVVTFGLAHVVGPDAMIVEDSGLFIDALHGFPGVYSAYVYSTIGFQGVLKLMEGVEERGAVFRSVIGLRVPGVDTDRHFIGECRGSISLAGRGGSGFGYDPIFVPEGTGETFAEMGTTEKNSLSHRGRSIRELVRFFIDGLL